MGIFVLSALIAASGQVFVAAPVLAVGSSITINSVTVTLQTDANSNSIANIGDTVRVEANIDNADFASNVVTADMTAYGGTASQALSAVGVPDGTGDVYRLDFTVLDAAGSGIDVAANSASSAVTVSVTDADDLVATTLASNNLGDGVVDTIATGGADTVAPTVTAAKISVTGASLGTASAYKIGSVVTAHWNDSVATGDNNSDTISGATADLSDWGGSATAAMTDTTACGGTASDRIYEACYTLVAAVIDVTNAEATVTATDNAGNTKTTADGTTYTVDAALPTVGAGNIAIDITGCPSSTCLIGNSMFATWDNSAAGDNNTDTIAGATANFSDFGGGTAVTMVDDGSGDDAVGADNIWTASYTVVAGHNTTPGHVSVTATDNAGNTKTTASTGTADVNNQLAGSSTGGSTVLDVVVVQPNGGETFQAGDHHTVVWSSNGNNIVAARVSLSTNGGSSYSTVATNEANDGAYSWVVPNVSTASAKIKVDALGQGGVVLVSDVSDAAFAIEGDQQAAAEESASEPMPAAEGEDVEGSDTSSSGKDAVSRTEADTRLPSDYKVDSLVKLSDDGHAGTEADSTVYYLGLDAKRHPFVTSAAYFSWYADFSKVKTIDAATLASIPLGAPILVRPGTHWVKIVSDAKTYYVEPGYKLRWIKDEAAAMMLGGADWNKNIVDVEPSYFTNFVMGSPIDVASLSISWPSGALVKSTDNTTIWYVMGGKRRAFNPPEAVGANEFQSRFVETDSGAGWQSLPVGTAVVSAEDSLFSLLH